MEKQKHATKSGADAGTEESPRSGNEHSSENNNASDQAMNRTSSLKRRRSDDHPVANPPHNRSLSMGSQQMTNGGPLLPPPPQNPHHMSQDMSGISTRDHFPGVHMSMITQNDMAVLPTPRMSNVGLPARTNGLALGDYSGSVEDYRRSVLQQSAAGTGQHLRHGGTGVLQNPMANPGGVMSYGDSPYNIGTSPQSQNGLNAFRIGESPMSASRANFLGQSPDGGSPGWLQLPSPTAALYTGVNVQSSSQHLRYPVLKPILPRISAIIPPALACDLLELYFSSSYSAFIQPASPYVLGFFFRKRAFLRPQNPRPCSPALLASMLWVAAQTSESSFLTSPPSARGRICQQLLELTISLLRPLVHNPPDGVATQGTNPVINGVALGGFGVALHTARHDNEGGSMGATGALDDVAAYINLATVVSASEYKGASLRWWNAAWSLARELKLGRELPSNPEPPMNQDEEDTNADVDVAMNGQPGMNSRRVNAPGTVSEEEREERRRIWWLLYIVDRHLALCYNRPLFLLDAECDGLLQPEDDVIFQAGDYYPAEHQQDNYFRRRGPSFECTGHSIFGYFLPLMTILGEIVDLNHARNHPRFGLRLRNGTDLDDMQHEISAQLDAYGRSLEALERRFVPLSGDNPQGASGNLADDKASPSNQSTSTGAGNRITEPVLLTKITVAYGTHLMHTLHILLNGKWDPISLIDDNDLWISSQSFISATGHAVAAAEAISGILDYDPDLSFMPFFFGIYLLQGSFLLLLIADKLQGDASAEVVRACETIVRAHEICVVTLNTEYQVSFHLFSLQCHPLFFFPSGICETIVWSPFCC